MYVVVNEDGSTSEYNQTEVEDGTVDRDNQRKANEDKYGCYMTDAQIDRGDCDIPEEEEVLEEKEKGVIIKKMKKNNQIPKKSFLMMMLWYHKWSLMMKTKNLLNNLKKKS